MATALDGAPDDVLDIFANVHRIASTGVTILLVEQNVRMALLLAQYGYIIRDGRILIEGPADELARDESVKLSFLGGTVANRDGAGANATAAPPTP